MSYLRHFLFALFALLAGVAAVNALLDPYDLLGTPVIHGVSQVKSPAPDRFFKPLQLSARQPRTVLLGSSRVMMGLDPADVPEGETYNLAVPAATIPEQIALARHALADAPVERLIIGLDYLSFNDAIEFFPSFRLAVLGRYALWRALPDILVSQRALVRSRTAYLLSRRFAAPSYRANGLRLVPDEPMTGTTSTERLLHQVAEYAWAYRAAVGYDKSLARFDAFLGGIALRRVTVLAFITPSHAALLATLEATGGRPAYDSWLRRLTAICAAHGVPLWDFGGYNRITTVPIDATQDSYYDGSHFRPSVGRLVLDTLLRADPESDFGARLTPETLPSYLAMQQAAGDAWREQLPEDWRQIVETVRTAEQAMRRRGG